MKADLATWRSEMEELSLVRPDLVRLWVERHPANLQLWMGWDCEDFHEEAFEHLLTDQEFLWLAPRGSGKSTSAAVIFAAWLSVSQVQNRDPAIPNLFPSAPREIGPHNVRIALTSNSSEKAVALHTQVKLLLQHERMHRLFGNLVGRRWRDESSFSALRTSADREGTFTAMGLGSKVTGGHYDIVICDDWVTEDNARTELQRSRIKDFWKFTVKGTCEPWARVVVCGTRYHPQDWYADIVEWHRKNLWGSYLRTPALTEDDDGTLRSYWPSQYPVEKLLQIKEQIGTVAFDTQYQNSVDTMLGAFFSPDWLQRLEPWEGLSDRLRLAARTSIGLDPAFKGGPRNDFTAFTVTSFSAPDFRIRWSERGQWTQAEILERGVRLYQRYRPHVMPVEVVAGQEWLVQEFRRKTSCPVRAMPARIDKLGRAARVRTFFETGRVAFEPPDEANGIRGLLDELMVFDGSPGRKDDRVDATVWSMLGLMGGRARAVRVNREDL